MHGTVGPIYFLSPGYIFIYLPLTHTSHNMYLNPFVMFCIHFSYLLASNFNPIHARQVFPCFDEPSKRAIFKVVINHPATYTNVLFSSHRVSRTTTPGTSQWVQDTFESTPYLPPHLLAIFIADRTYTHEAIVIGDRHSVS